MQNANYKFLNLTVLIDILFWKQNPIIKNELRMKCIFSIPEIPMYRPNDPWVNDNWTGTNLVTLRNGWIRKRHEASTSTVVVLPVRILSLSSWILNLTVSVWWEHDWVNPNLVSFAIVFEMLKSPVLASVGRRPLEPEQKQKC